MRLLLAVAVLLTLSSAAALAETAAGGYRVDLPHVAAGPPVDGTLTDPAWQSAMKVDLAYDLRFNRPAAQRTTAYIVADDKAIYVAFDAEQRGEIVATQHTNDVGFDSDDEVQIDLWPGGNSGFRYMFTATPNGTHYQHSTENSSYAPTWNSVGKLRPGGYTVTMRIGFDTMRGDGRGEWRAQLVRFVVRTDEKFVWAHFPNQSNDHNDVTFSGTLSGMSIAARSARPKPRVALYSLAELGSANADGNTSRAGADISLPITPSASFVGTFHPDYSNVERDQQTISPTAYRRFIDEVRPFFTQGAPFYNPFDCEVCPGVTELYTPSIPTPRRGYAVEGKQGQLNFAGYDAVGDARTDIANTIYYDTVPRTLILSYQGVNSYAPGFADRLDTFGVTLGDRKHLVSYFNYGFDRGTNVLDNAQAQRTDFGAAYYGGDWYFGGGIRKLGKYYNPVDGLIQSPDVAGWSWDGDRTFRFKTGKPLKYIDINGYLERYHGEAGGWSRTSNDFTLTIVTKTQFRLSTDTGAYYQMLSNGILSPVTQVGVALGYLPGTSTPTSFVYNQGRFGNGRLGTFQRSSTFKLGPRTSISLQGDDTVWYADAGHRDVQWLERLAVTRQFSLNSSFAVGLRKIIGTPPTLDVPQSFVNQSNVSFAYSRRTQHSELFFVYGDASALTTKPALTVKYIYYIGAEKGT
jgi:hypothetical protein